MKLTIEKSTLISAEQEPDDRELIVPDGVKTIADEGLAHLPLIERIVLPCSVRSIGHHALLGDVSLRELTFPLTASLKDGALTIDSFHEIRLEKLTLTVPEGKGDTVISKAFAKNLTKYMPSPRHVVFGPGLVQVTDRIFPYFFRETQILEFGKGLKETGIDNFKGMKNLTRVIFPGTLTIVSDGSFRNCPNLHEARLPEACKVCVDAFEDCGTMRDGKKLAAPEFAVTRYQPSEEELEPPVPIETLTLPGIEMKVQGNRLLSTTAADSVREIVVPKGIRVIETEGLAHLPHVKKITLPGSVAYIMSRAFFGDIDLRELFFPANAWVADGVLDNHIFYDEAKKVCRKNPTLACLTLTAPKGKRLMRQKNSVWHNDVVHIKRLVFEPGIEVISDSGAPIFCNSAERIEFGEGLRTIGKDNFHLSYEIREIYFPSTLESIGNRSFCFLHLLREVHLPKDCKLGSRVFGNCPPRLTIIRE